MLELLELFTAAKSASDSEQAAQSAQLMVDTINRQQIEIRLLQHQLAALDRMQDIQAIILLGAIVLFGWLCWRLHQRVK